MLGAQLAVALYPEHPVLPVSHVDNTPIKQVLQVGGNACSLSFCRNNDPDSDK